VRVMYYMPIDFGDIGQFLEAHKANRFPGHLLYGATLLPSLGVPVLFHCPRRSPIKNRLLRFLSQNLINAYSLVRSRRSYDAVYAPYKDGLELLVLLRALRVFPRPIMVWQHSTLTSGAAPRAVVRFYHRGIDRFFFVNEMNRKESLAARVVRAQKTKVMPWGPDLSVYDSVRLTAMNPIARPPGDPVRFITTGKDSRDFETLFEAFRGQNASLSLFITDKSVFQRYVHREPNISVHYVERSLDATYRLLFELAEHDVVVACCYVRPLSTGITSLFDGIGFGKPVVITKNPYLDIDVEKIGFGISVDVGDVAGWRSAIDKLNSSEASRTEMGVKARAMAERQLNFGRFVSALVEEFRLTIFEAAGQQIQCFGRVAR